MSFKYFKITAIVDNEEVAVCWRALSEEIALRSFKYQFFFKEGQDKITSMQEMTEEEVKQHVAERHQQISEAIAESYHPQEYFDLPGFLFYQSCHSFALIFLLAMAKVGADESRFLFTSAIIWLANTFVTAYFSCKKHKSKV